jgi:hypothetical protein
VALVRTDVSEEPGASFIRVTTIDELGTTQAATSNRRTRNILRSVRRLLVAACVVPSSSIVVTLMKEAPGSSETSVLTIATPRNNPEDTILHSHCRENLKSYFNALTHLIVSVFSIGLSIVEHHNKAGFLLFIHLVALRVFTDTKTYSCQQSP